jgi:hypothetical protein
VRAHVSHPVPPLRHLRSTLPSPQCDLLHTATAAPSEADTEQRGGGGGRGQKKCEKLQLLGDKRLQLLFCVVWSWTTSHHDVRNVEDGLIEARRSLLTLRPPCRSHRSWTSETHSQLFNRESGLSCHTCVICVHLATKLDTPPFACHAPFTVLVFVCSSSSPLAICARCTTGFRCN